MAFANTEGIRRWAYPVLWGLIAAGAVLFGAMTALINLLGS
jgi:hypothetical protein